MKVLVTGASGFVGKHLIRELKRAGHQVLAIVRKGRQAEGAYEIEGDLTDLTTINMQAIEGCAAAIHLVGIIREFPQRRITFQHIHVDATRNLLRICQHTGIKRYMHMSALGARLDSKAVYLSSKAEAEELVRSSQLNWTIIRPAVIIGNNGAFFKMIRRLASSPVIPLIGTGAAIMAPISIATVTAAFAQALATPASIGKTYDLGGEILTYREMMQKLAQILGKKPRFISLPISLMRKLASLLDRFAFFPITSEQITMLAEAVEPESLEIYGDLGLEFKWFEEVLQDALKS